MKIRRINGGLSVGRTWVGFQRVPGHVPRRFGRRSGGTRTPGPWSECDIPFFGSIRVSHDRTLFGWDDPASSPGSGLAGAMRVDIYPVGWLAVLLRLRRAYAAGFPAEHRQEARTHARGAVRYQLRRNVEQIRAGKWRGLKNTLSGYLAEPTPFPAGVRRCGSGWTKRRAGRSLDRQLADAVTSIAEISAAEEAAHVGCQGCQDCDPDLTEAGGEDGPDHSPGAANALPGITCEIPGHCDPAALNTGSST